jgi:DNA polymerase-3 subunit gamma/tau
MADAPHAQGAGGPSPEGARPAPAAPYLVTARKYRPQTFGDMVGQEHVAQTLQNAIRLGRLAHAYLFSGPRGVGKTTAARVLAKAVNCQTPLAERDGAEPCRRCTSCHDFEEGRSLNVIEVDAASNNSVNDVRDLRETVRVPPQGAKKKVYILDEIHMMSAAAFNALLKTLEEPPPYVLFVFATTEPHKVLPTILSRTQRFDFRRIAVPEIVGRLRMICAEEGIEADDEALLLLARKGDGALRDALSLFDQAVALCGTPLHGSALREALGVVETDLFFEATERVAAHDRAGLLGLVDRLVHRGYDLAEFLAGLAEHVRALLVAASTGRADLIEATDATRQRYLAAAHAWAEADLLHLLMIVDEAERHLRASRQPRLTVELALLKMASLTPAADLQHLLEGLARLETGGPTGGPRAASSERTMAGVPAPIPEPLPDHIPSPSAAGAPKPAPAPAPPKAAPPDEPASDADEDDGDEPAFSPAPPRRPTGAAPPPEPAPPAPAGPAYPGLFSAPALTRRRPGDATGDGADASATLVVTPPGEDGEGGLSSPDGLPRPGGEPSLQDEFSLSVGRVREVWPKLVARVKAERVHVGALLQLAEPQRAVKGAVEVAVADEFGRALLESEAAGFRSALGALLGEPAPALRFVVRAPEAETAAQEDPFERLKRLRQEHPVFRTLFERFGAEIVWT